MISKIKNIFIVFLICGLNIPAFAAPNNAAVTHGNVHITKDGSNTTVNQYSDKAVINWESFDINKGESVRFNQNSSSSIVLNRVIGGNPTSIFGNLSANGKVFIINRAGLLIGQGASINTGSFLASSADISDKDFISGNYSFKNAAGNIINNGSIKVSDGGYAVLTGKRVENNGLIAAKLGKIYLASGEAFRLDMSGDDLIGVAVEKGIEDAYVANGGIINAEASAVVMTAKNVSDMIRGAVNNTGVINASSISYSGGKVILGADNAEVFNSGKIDVSSDTDSGGIVEISSDRIINGGVINADGSAKGGDIYFNASEYLKIYDKSIISANSNGYGNAGNIRLISGKDVAAYSGALIEAKSVYGNGGFIEFSGGNSVYAFGDFNTSSRYGKNGLFLLDPSDMYIGNYRHLQNSENNAIGADGNTYVDIDWLIGQLNNGDVILRTASQGPGAGNIQLDAAVALIYNGNNTLTLNAINNINLLGSIDISNLSLSAAGNIIGNNSLTSNNLNVISDLGTIELTKLNLTGESRFEALNGNIHLVGSDISGIKKAEAFQISIESDNGISTSDYGNAASQGVIKGNEVILKAGGDIQTVIDTSSVSAEAAGSITVTNMNEGTVFLNKYAGGTPSTYNQDKGVINIDRIDSSTLNGDTLIASKSGIITATDRLFVLKNLSNLKLESAIVKFIETGGAVLTVNNALIANYKANRYSFDNKGGIIINSDVQNSIANTSGFELISREGSVTTDGKLNASFLYADALKDINVSTNVSSGSFRSIYGNITVSESNSINIDKLSALNGNIGITLEGQGRLTARNVESVNPINITASDASGITIAGSGISDLDLHISNGTAGAYDLQISNGKNKNIVADYNNDNFNNLSLKSSGGSILINSITGGAIKAANRITLEGSSVNGSDELRLDAKEVAVNIGGEKNLTINADFADLNGGSINAKFEKDIIMKDINGDKLAGNILNLSLESDYGIIIEDRIDAGNFLSRSKSLVFGNGDYLGMLVGNNISIYSQEAITGAGKIAARKLYMEGLTIGVNSDLLVYSDKAVFNALDTGKTSEDTLIDIHTDSWYDGIQNYEFITAGAGVSYLNNRLVNTSLYGNIQTAKTRNLNPAEILNIDKVSGDDLIKGGRILDDTDLINVEKTAVPKAEKFIYKNKKTEIK